MAFDPSAFDAGAFDAPSATSFTANAVIKKAQSGSFTADGIVRKSFASSFTADGIVKRAVSTQFIADSVIKRVQAGSFTADAYLFSGVISAFTADAITRRAAATSFTVMAHIAGGNRWRHHRVRDHFGAEDTLYVVLAEDIGPWIAGTPVQYVLDDLATRVANLESATRQLGSFTANAVVLTPGTTIGGRSLFLADAVLKRNRTATFTANALINRSFSFTMDAFIQARFTANAVIV